MSINCQLFLVLQIILFWRPETNYPLCISFDQIDFQYIRFSYDTIFPFHRSKKRHSLNLLLFNFFDTLSGHLHYSPLFVGVGEMQVRTEALCQGAKPFHLNADWSTALRKLAVPRQSVTLFKFCVAQNNEEHILTV